jgi:hypothetical protein
MENLSELQSLTHSYAQLFTTIEVSDLRKSTRNLHPLLFFSNGVAATSFTTDESIK